MSGERWCHICGRTVEGSVCSGCALDLDTGELVGVPQALDHRDFDAGAQAEYRLLPPRPFGDLFFKLYEEMRYRLLGTMGLWVLLNLFYGMRAWTTIFATAAVGCLLVLRCGATYRSPILDTSRGGKPREEPGGGPGAHPEEGFGEEKGEEQDEPQPEPPRITAGLALQSLVEAVAATVLLGLPAAATLDSQTFASLKAAGALPPLMDTLALARISAVGTVFLGALAFAIWLRLAHAGPHRNPALEAEDAPLIAAVLLRGLGVGFVLALMLVHPVLILCGVLAFPLVLGALSDTAPGAWLPWNMYGAARARQPKAYLRILLCSAPLLGLVLWSLSQPWDNDSLGSVLQATLGTVAGSLLGILCGIDHYDTATRFVRIRRPDPDLDPSGEAPSPDSAAGAP
jgi:hypothetical protein